MSSQARDQIIGCPRVDQFDGEIRREQGVHLARMDGRQCTARFLDYLKHFAKILTGRMSALQSKRIIKAQLDRNVHHDQRPRNANGRPVSERMTDAFCTSQPFASALVKESDTTVLSYSVPIATIRWIQANARPNLISL
jgi:hypothetical protein